MTEKDSKAYMYVVECADGTLYTGYTTDVERRLKTHNAGKGAKYTRARLPVKLLYSEAFTAEWSDYQPMLDHFHLEYCSHSSTTHARE